MEEYTSWGYINKRIGIKRLVVGGGLGHDLIHQGHLGICVSQSFVVERQVGEW